MLDSIFFINASNSRLYSTVCFKFLQHIPRLIYTSMNVHGMVKYLHEVTEGGECTMKNSE